MQSAISGSDTSPILLIIIRNYIILNTFFIDENKIIKNYKSFLSIINPLFIFFSKINYFSKFYTSKFSAFLTESEMLKMLKNVKNLIKHFFD